MSILGVSWLGLLTWLFCILIGPKFFFWSIWPRRTFLKRKFFPTWEFFWTLLFPVLVIFDFFLKIFLSWPIRTGKKVLVLWPALSNKFPTIYIIDVGWFACLFVCYRWNKKMSKMAVFDWLFGFLTTFPNILGRGKKNPILEFSALSIG